MELKELLIIIFALLVGVLVFRIFNWLLPVIVVLLIAYFVYIYLNERF